MTTTTAARPAGRPAGRVQGRTRVAVVVGAAATLLAAVLVGAHLAWPTDAVQDFVARYPGVAPGAEHVGTPAWVGVLHAANLLLMVLAARSGLLVRSSRRPAGRWTRRRPGRSGRRPTPVTLEQWFHVSVDVVWLAVGAVYLTLLVVDGRWVRLVPRTWEVLPHAASVLVQYLSLHPPTEHGWVAYNAAQMLAYAAIVLVVAPLSALTGLRLSVLWPQTGRLARLPRVERARALHLPLMAAFGAFVVLHVGLVLGTGAVRNLNHMFGARDDASLVGPLVALGVVALTAGAWWAVRPAVLRPLGATVGKVTR